MQILVVALPVLDFKTAADSMDKQEENSKQFLLNEHHRRVCTEHYHCDHQHFDDLHFHHLYEVRQRKNDLKQLQNEPRNILIRNLILGNCRYYV